MTIISPSLLACDFAGIKAELEAFKNHPNLWFHLDIMDGHFVPNLTFGQPVIRSIAKIAKHPLDAHLMVSNPEFYIEDMKDYSLHNITFHIEAHDNPQKLITDAKNFFPSVGISLKPKTPVSDIPIEVLSEVNLLLVMTVEPGFGGQSFMHDCALKVQQLDELRKVHKLNFQIQVDGGINTETAKIVKNFGADNLVAGSYIFKQDPSKYLDAVESLR